jgi:site-specific DNA-cytosine methylase
MPAHRRPEVAKKYWELYQQGFSCEDVGKAFGVGRNSVWKVLKNHGYDLRAKKLLPFIEFEGKRYTPDNDGYYRCTERDHNIFLHRVIWEQQNGAIPDGYHIHHKNGDKSDNRIENLECVTPSEHGTIHGFPEGYEFKPGQLPHNARAVRRLDTGEIYPSSRRAAAAIGRSQRAIWQAITNKTKSAGTYWEYAD